MSATRRLAAILAADVAGYSWLIGTDEEGTLERLRSVRSELIDPSIASHNGRVVKTTGDGFLAEFTSTIDALRCAGEVQAQMAARNGALKQERRIDFRIGIHQGDIAVEDGDIFGDGVNIAARLEALAEPGGICVSARVQEDAAGKLDLTFRDLGDLRLKNIARPVRAYAVGADVLVPRKAHWRYTAVAAGTAGLIAAGLVTWWEWPKKAPGAAQAPAMTNIPTPAVADVHSAPRLSIVVLPFTNLSNDPEQGYLADGIAEDLTTALSRISDSVVISRNTAFTYRNQLIDTKQIGRHLGVRYVVEGSVRRSGDQVRATAQLIDAATDAHLWADSFDSNTGNLLALQNEIAGRLANALGVELIAKEAARPTENPDALDYILRGRAADAKPPTREKYIEAISLYERALALDPRSVEAQSRLANVLTGRVLDAMTDSAEADITRAEGLVGQALASTPLNPLAHFAKGNVRRAQHRWAEAIPEYETTLESFRNSATTLHILGQCKLLTGAIEETIPLHEQAIRLSPRDPNIGNWYFEIGRVHLLQSRIGEAIFWLEKARSTNPAHPPSRANLAAAYALRGETERAAAELAAARSVVRDDRFSSIARLRAVGFSGMMPSVRALFETTYFVGLRKAGVPEE